MLKSLVKSNQLRSRKLCNFRFVQLRKNTQTLKALMRKPFTSLSIGIPHESYKYDSSVAMDPTTVDNLVNLGFQVNIEHDAGENSHYSNEIYSFCGANITDIKTVFSSDVIYKSQPPTSEEADLIKPSSVLFCGFWDNHYKVIQKLIDKKIPFFDTNYCIGKVMRKYMDMTYATKMHYGLGWTVLSEIVQAYGRPLCQHYKGKKLIPAAKIVCSNHIRTAGVLDSLKMMGAEVTPTTFLDENFDFSKCDVVVLPMMRPDSYLLKFGKKQFEQMKPGSVLIDNHHGDIPTYEGTFAGNKMIENNRTLVGINNASVHVVGNSLPKFRGAVFYSLIMGTSLSGHFDMNNPLIKNSDLIYEPPTFRTRREITDLFRGKPIPYKKTITVISVLGGVFLLIVPFYFLK